MARIDPARGHRGFVVARFERPVAFCARGVHLGECDRHREVVVERGARTSGVHSPGSTAPTRLRTRCRKSSMPV